MIQHPSRCGPDAAAWQQRQGAFIFRDVPTASFRCGHIQLKSPESASIQWEIRNVANGERVVVAEYAFEVAERVYTSDGGSNRELAHQNVEHGRENVDFQWSDRKAKK